VIVIDSSAIVAIILGEPAAEELAERLAKEPIGSRLLSVASYLEAGAVLAGREKRNPKKAITFLEGVLSQSNIDLAPVDAEQARVALQARIEFGRGFGSAAGLNYGDCFSYALAKTLGAPLLYVGNDFDKTDIKAALKVR
jgi:ribonuclease VapC